MELTPLVKQFLIVDFSSFKSADEFTTWHSDFLDIIVSELGIEGLGENWDELFGYDFCTEFYKNMNHWALIRANDLKASEESTPIEIDGVSYKKLFQFKIAHIGWESDNKGWIVENQGQRFIVLTNHGAPYIAEKLELINKINEYEYLISNTHRALYLLD